MRDYLHLPEEIVPATMKKTAARAARPEGSRPETREGADRPSRFGDKKVGPSGDAKPTFREGGFGRGGGAPRDGAYRSARA